MKKLLLFILLSLVFTSFANAQLKQIAVVKDGNWAFYDNLTNAINNADPGSDVIIPGGDYSFNTQISKELHLYGAGHYPLYTEATGVTFIVSQIAFNPGSDNSTLTGLKIHNLLVQNDVDNISMTRCFLVNNVEISMSTTNFSCRESVIKCIYGQRGGGINQYSIFEKNIITGDIAGLDFAIFSNNIITKNVSFVLHVISNSIFRNNVFTFDDHSFLEAVNSCIFEKNIFKFDASGSFPSSGTNTSIDNLYNLDPALEVFVNFSTYGFDYGNDYHLQSSCPGKNYGTDGTDVGIYGTAYPYKEGAVPIIPHYTNSEIGSELIDGKLHLEITVEAQTK